MSILQSIKEEHNNRAKWLDENLTIRERMRVDREVVIKVGAALIFYIVVMWLMEMVI